ncbi:glycoside hydrolase [Rhodofomes roseus]|uniref:alpha-1,2-Mannosidase n=2 Tax=Rhodofomes roseus TaxID=34475 RepID=A0ABQ8KNE8_9APHY|nr:glycoside hydrolase [Rhodofomes roseus]KAH9839937.1 glycoside hydrolase [Rhodofomes roseus]
MLPRMFHACVEYCRARRLTGRHLLFATIGCVFVITLYYSTLQNTVSSSEIWRTIRPVSTTPPHVWKQRAEAVKNAFRHAYNGYERHAKPHDELRPLTNGTKDNFNGWGVSLFDSLDTMIMMGLNDEFARALPVVSRATFETNAPVTNRHVGYAPFFETVIRYLGGLLSAYALSREPLLLQRADDLGRMLSPAFDTPSGFPAFGVDTVTGETVGGASGVLAEIATCQVEYAYLALLTGNKMYWENADVVMKGLWKANVTRLGGMLPRRWNLATGNPGDEFLSVGAAADSAHEYLLKQYLLTGKQDKEALQLYLRATNHIFTHMLYLSEARDLLYVTDTNRNFIPSHNFEHLSCFLPGLLALGADQLDLSLDDLDYETLGPVGQQSYDILRNYDLRALHRWAAEGLATTCWLLYEEQPSGLGPDVVHFQPKVGEWPARGSPPDHTGKLWVEGLEKWRRGGARGYPPGLGEKKPVRLTRDEIGSAKLRALRVPERDYVLTRSEYFLRPETLESIYLMWRSTGDPIWRERGWSIFEAIERETKTASGYASSKNILLSPTLLDDDMPSYFLAETLKYLYLLFHDEDLVPLDRWVFNTEAHPLPVFSWSSWERNKFGIPEPSS